MSIKSKRFGILILILVFSLTACGTPPQETTTVNVTVNEFTFQSSITNFETGKTYRFVITNSGILPHEFTIMPPGPTVEETEGMDHGMKDALVHVGDDELVPGATVTVEYIFEEPAALGSIEFACHVTGHYEAGMRTPISVDV